MRGVPADLAVLLLQRSGITITPATLRAWRHRGHIHRHADGGYDLESLLAHAQRRTAHTAG